MDVELTEDDKAALTESLRRMGLVGITELPELIPLTGGVSSQIAVAKTTRQLLCVKRALAKLKVAADWSAPLERNAAEVAWMRLAARIVPGCVPEILGEDAEARAFAMSYLDPSQYRVWKSELLDGIGATVTARQIGETLSAIHRATADDLDIKHDFATDASFFALRLEPYFLATAAAHPDCAAELESLSATTGNTARALVHGDVSPKNILIGPTGPVILDAECAWYGDPAFDIAFCLTHLLLKCVARPAAVSAYLACFSSLANAYFSGVTWESESEINSRVSKLVPALLLARIDGKSPVEYITSEKDRDDVRRFAKRSILNAPATVDELRHRWIKERV
jgi:aminoglycoside phosphotransferase (APT) family kinase protein